MLIEKFDINLLLFRYHLMLKVPTCTFAKLGDNDVTVT